MILPSLRDKLSNVKYYPSTQVLGYFHNGSRPDAKHILFENKQPGSLPRFVMSTEVSRFGEITIDLTHVAQLRFLAQYASGEAQIIAAAASGLEKRAL